MLSHKFNIGEIVSLKPAIKRNILGGIYQVTKQLPENQGELEYCIKNPKEPYARVVRERELAKPITSESIVPPARAQSTRDRNRTAADALILRKLTREGLKRWTGIASKETGKR